MGNAVLSEYLLKLATDVHEYEKFTGAKLKGKKDLLQDAGLSAQQAEALLSGDARRLTVAVLDELEKNASSKEKFRGNTIAIVLPMDNIEHHHLILAEAEDE